MNQTPDTAYGAAPFILSNLAFGANNQPSGGFTQSGCPTNNRFNTAGCVSATGTTGTTRLTPGTSRGRSWTQRQDVGGR